MTHKVSSFFIVIGLFAAQHVNARAVFICVQVVLEVEAQLSVT